MQQYKIMIKETLVKVVKVEADSKEEALQIADNNYRAAKDDYVLSADDFDTVTMEIVNK